MKSTHCNILQKDLEELFQSAKSDDYKQAIMDVWEKGIDLDLSSTSVAMNIAAASKHESITVFQRYFANGYKKAIEYTTTPPKLP